MGIRLQVILLSTFVVLAGAHPVLSAENCTYSKAVCDTRSVVFAIKAFDPLASAVRIGPELLVTSRHAIADEVDVRVNLVDKAPLTAEVVPSSYPGDIILLKVPGLPDGPELQPARIDLLEKVYSVGADVSRGKIRVYPPGKIMFLPAKGFPLARLHHDAYSQPGNSGGALINSSGHLVGIVTSGGDGRYEAIPLQAIDALKKASGSKHRQRSREISGAIRICVLKLEETRSIQRRRLAVEEAKALKTSCRRSQNRQLMDLAAQMLGLTGHVESSIQVFQKSLKQDPYALNTRIGLLVSLSLGRRHENSLPHLRWLLDNGVNDLQVLRLAIQSGVWGGDKPLAERAFRQLKEINPRMAPTAKRFLTNPPPKPKTQAR